MPFAKTQKAPSMAAQHGPSVARDALLKAYAPIASAFVSSLKGTQGSFFYAESHIRMDSGDGWPGT